MLMFSAFAGNCGVPRSPDVIQLASQFQLNFFPAATVLAQQVASLNSTGNKGGKVVGGQDVIDPTGGLLCWQVAIQLKGLPGLVRCGGSIIGSRTILTAGHCVMSNRGSSIRSADSSVVVVGALDSSFSGGISDHGAAGCGRSYRVAQVIQHPDFHKILLNNDVALLILEEDIDLSARCSCAICLTGKIPNTGEWNPVPLKFIYQQILQNFVSPKCRYANGVNGDNFLCAGGVIGTDNCYGDSGGPLVCYDSRQASYYQSGIVSFGPGACGDGQGSRYTKVEKYLQWIVASANGDVSILE
ncbi:putative Tryptase-2 [Hypsibius exemplaris]|uniref:Tryptase-2 n=1 Tax=Hypsibius exemplaris TaxID=2072580 RepID=A0A9X6RKG8_HYPEX|nr:putative Tryptase-2 [Hypsibius exemplaris]